MARWLSSKANKMRRKKVTFTQQRYTYFRGRFLDSRNPKRDLPWTHSTETSLEWFVIAHAVCKNQESNR